VSDFGEILEQVSIGGAAQQQPKDHHPHAGTYPLQGVNDSSQRWRLAQKPKKVFILIRNIQAPHCHGSVMTYRMVKMA
jgi:hypothetical protein